MAHFVKAGFDTYLIDWGTPTNADRNLTLDTYVNGYLRRVVRYSAKAPPPRPKSTSSAIAWAAR